MYLINIILSIIGLLLMMFGYQSTSQLTIYVGGLIFITPIIYLIGCAVVLPFVPVVALTISFLGKKKENST